MEIEKNKPGNGSGSTCTDNATDRVIYLAYRQNPEQLLTPEPQAEAVYGSPAPQDPIKAEIVAFKPAAAAEEMHNSEGEHR